MATKNKLIAELRKAGVSEELIDQVVSSIGQPKKRGRPKSTIQKPQKTPKAPGRIRKDETSEHKCRAIAIWILLDMLPLPQLQKRRMIAKCLMKSMSWVDKQVTIANVLMKAGHVWVSTDKKVIMLANDDEIDRILFADRLGLSIEQVFEKIIPIEFKKK